MRTIRNYRVATAIGCGALAVIWAVWSRIDTPPESLPGPPERPITETPTERPEQTHQPAPDTARVPISPQASVSVSQISLDPAEVLDIANSLRDMLRNDRAAMDEAVALASASNRMEDMKKMYEKNVLMTQREIVIREFERGNYEVFDADQASARELSEERIELWNRRGPFRASDGVLRQRVIRVSVEREAIPELFDAIAATNEVAIAEARDAARAWNELPDAEREARYKRDRETKTRLKEIENRWRTGDITHAKYQELYRSLEKDLIDFRKIIVDPTHYMATPFVVAR
jgi:hypothetical protein